MSRDELVGAYLDGQISRRTLVRRLVAGGVSIGAAVSYAQVLKPGRALAGNDNDHYPDTTVRLVSDDIDEIFDKGKFVVKVRVDEDCELNPLEIRCYHKVGPSLTLVASKSTTINGPKTKNVGVPLGSGASGLLSLDKAKIKTTYIGYDQQGKTPNGSSVSTIKR